MDHGFQYLNIEDRFSKTAERNLNSLDAVSGIDGATREDSPHKYLDEER